MKEETKILVSKGRLDEALNKLVQYSDDAILLKSRLSNIKRDYQIGIITHSDYSREINLINYSILGILDNIDDTETSDIPHDINNRNNVSSSKPKSTTPKVFFSYSHDDRAHLNDLLTYLAPLERAKKIEIWTDTQILPGQEWSKTIIDNLHQADIVVMLVSADFLASSYIWENELQISLENKSKKRTIVVPVILKPSLWQHTILKAYQALPIDDNGKLKPVILWDERDEAWLKVAEGILKLLEN